MTDNISILMAFGAGLLSFLSPCVLPLIPSYLCIIGGAPLADLNAGSNFKPQLVKRTLFFVLGFSAVFIVLSVVFSATIGILGGLFRWINIVSGAVVIVLGINTFYNFFTFLNYEKRFSIHNRQRGFTGAFLAGGAFGAGWTPCIGPVLAGILLLAAQSGGIPKAVLFLSFFSAGLGLPFLLASAFFNVFLKVSGKLRKQLPVIQKISGILLIVLGITMISGHFRALSALTAKWQSSLSAKKTDAGKADDNRVLISAAAEADTSVSDNTISQDVISAFRSAGIPVAMVGIVPPDFTLAVLDGTSIKLSDMKGKAVFLNFWATWCGPCKAEMPSMEAVYRQLKDRGFEILAVNIQEDPETVRAFMQDNKLRFTVAMDSSGSVGIQYGIQAIPTTYIIDKRGLVVSRIVGSIDWNKPKIISAIEMLL